ncbi:hypothetical protein C5Y96_12230 [Blastopirellula marina]|uniref:Leucine-rich repeat domain-containing protein n=1 Tax=Blastopirellula marina TaxID=124 RepID=A0A2S8FG12_9BACT|nr:MULTISPECIES: hypothetical protein [Pirellulaceae]PQO31118.1 hypothetical protein C5Y96_12230 [Blastopirellula marina]RCS51512.1 hypothetical protein DTL36_12240 [Bremerella cremea]
MNSTNESTKKPKRRWLSFGLRGLMVLVLLLSLPMGWIARDVYRTQRETEAVTAIEKTGGYAMYDYQKLSAWGEPPNLPGPWILRKLFGDHIHAHVDLVVIGEKEDVNTLVPLLASCGRLGYLQLPSQTLSDQSIETLARLPKLVELVLYDTPLTVEQLKLLSQAPSLRSIKLTGPTATDQHLQQLSHFSNLEKVTLKDTTITDSGMQSLGQLPELAWLEIEHASAVTNAGLAALTPCQKLTHLWLRGTKVDNGCIETLKSLPEVDDVYIIPDVLEIEYQAQESMRLDTLTPVKISTQSAGLCGTFAATPSEKTGPPILRIGAASISVDRFNEDELIDLPQSQQETHSP